MLAGHQQEIQADRDRKLEAAREQRKNRRQRAAERNRSLNTEEGPPAPIAHYPKALTLMGTGGGRTLSVCLVTNERMRKLATRTRI